MLSNHIQDIGDFLDVGKVAIAPATFTLIDISFNFFFWDICILFFFQTTVIIVTVCDYMATLNKDYLHTCSECKHPDGENTNCMKKLE